MDGYGHALAIPAPAAAVLTAGVIGSVVLYSVKSLHVKVKSLYVKVKTILFWNSFIRYVL